MATVAVSSHGTLLKIGDGAGSETFTTIGEVMDISGVGISVRNTEVTSHDSSGWAEFISTIREIGEVTFTINFNNVATQGFSGGLYLDALNRTKRNFQIVIPTTSSKTGSFAALVQEFKLDTPVDGAITASLTLKGTGAIAWA